MAAVDRAPWGFQVGVGGDAFSSACRGSNRPFPVGTNLGEAIVDEVKFNLAPAFWAFLGSVTAPPPLSISVILPSIGS